MILKAIKLLASLRGKRGKYVAVQYEEKIMVKTDKNFTFEENLKKLENIVDQLESGEIDIEKSVELYEKGMLLKNNCEAKLKKVELQIKKIKMENNKIQKEDFK